MKKLIASIKLHILFICSLMALAGCGDSFLELKDPGSISTGNFPTKLGHVDLLVSSVYGAQHHWTFLGHTWAGYVAYCLDHTVDQQWRGDQTWIDIHAGTVQPGNSKVENPWKAINMGVYYANSALEGIAAYRGIALSSETEKLNNYEGECLFLRAFYWWHLLSVYGRPEMDGVGIPIVRSVPKTLEDMAVPREKTGDCYLAIINDLKLASTLLKGQTDNHRATEWSAKAALAKACLFAGKTDSAKIYLEDCIQNSGKRLVPFDKYRMMFNGYTEYEYNSESFYEVGNKADPVSGNAYGSINTGTALSILYAPFCIAPDGSRTAMSYSNQFTHDRNLLRFGYTDPAPLTQLESTGTGEHIEWHLKPSYMDQQKERREKIGRQEDGPDPRLFVCALQPFIDSVQMKINNLTGYRLVAQTESGKWWEMDPTTGNDPKTFYGWPTRKYQFLEGHMSETRNVAGYNLYFIRLPDVYLMYAEILKDSDPTKALEYINKVKRRAYNYDSDTASPIDYKSLTDRTKAPTGDHLANNPLLYERWAEMFGEMRWWEDVRRLNIGQQEADFYQTVSGPGSAKTKITWRDTHYAMPVPVLEFETNTHPGMVQTPGYN